MSRRPMLPAPAGKLPLTPDMLINRPSGDIFGMTLNAGMGWEPEKLNGKEGCADHRHHRRHLAGADGKPVALGLHTGHYETPLQFEAAAARGGQGRWRSLGRLCQRSL